MLVLGRKTAQAIQIGDDIHVTILKVQGNSVRVGIKAPGNVRILRGELESSQQAWGPDTKFDFEQSDSKLSNCK